MMRPCPIAHAAAEHPQALAVFDEEQRWTYAALDARVARWAAVFEQSGVARGDRVAVVSGNRLELVAQIWALGRIGAAFCPINVRLTDAEREEQIAWLQPKAVIADPINAGRAGAECWDERLTRVPVATSHAASLDPDATFAILFTSGTSGRAKAAALTLENFFANADASAKNIGGASSDQWLGTLPMFHIGGLSMAFKCGVYGASMRVFARFDATEVSEAIDTGATHVSLVATTLQRVLEERHDRRFPSSLRAILVGGGPVPNALWDRARALGAPVLQTYGLTEACSQVTTERPDEADGETAGPVLPGMQLRVVDGQGEDLPLGVVGEIEVQGPNVMRGYFRDEFATHETLWEGWLRTRDLGFLDGRGRLTVVSRRSDLIISGGENVYPAEIERVLSQHPSIVECAVIGHTHPQWGEVPIAFIVTLGNVAPDWKDLSTFCSERLARFKLPRGFLPLPALPRNAMGKIDRATLRSYLSAPAAAADG